MSVLFRGFPLCRKTKGGTLFNWLGFRPPGFQASHVKMLPEVILTILNGIMSEAGSPKIVARPSLHHATHVTPDS